MKRALIALLLSLGSKALAQAAPTSEVTVPLAELASSSDALRLSTRASESLGFAARSDRVLTAAVLQLPLREPQGMKGLRSLVVQLNGEQLTTFTPEQLRKSSTVRVPIDASLLASNNQLTFRYLTAADPHGCGRVPAGTWSSVAAAGLTLRSSALPLPSDLSVLPLPFVDAQFDHQQTLHFVMSSKVDAAGLQAANLVAAYFSLQGSTRLSFETHLDALPDGDAVVLIDDAKTAAVLNLAVPTGEAGELLSGVELRANPKQPARKLLVLWGLSSEGLAAPARKLLRAKGALQGTQAAAVHEPELPLLPPYGVPRWVKSSDVVLGKLPEHPALRTQGGSADTLRLPFRIAPDSFGWPSEHVQLELTSRQAYSASSGAAHVHVALNGSSVGVLPRTRNARTVLRLPRALLRGFNELLVQVSYPDAALPKGEQCATGADDKVWFELAPESKLALGDTRQFAVLPDLSTFLYDGYPFTDHGDLRETALVLPQRPSSAELSAMLGAIAHFTNITGAAPTGLSIVLGTPSNQLLSGRDTLLIATQGRHPLLERWRAALPLHTGRSGTVTQYPTDSTWWRRWLTARFGNAERERAQRALDDGAFAAVMGLPAPWEPERSLVVVTASDTAHMPRLTTLMDRSEAVRQRNDLLIVTDARRGLFQLGVEHTRGSLPELLSLRFWLAHYWLVLVPALLLAAVLNALHGYGVLSRLAHRRLHEVDG